MDWASIQQLGTPFCPADGRALLITLPFMNAVLRLLEGQSNRLSSNQWDLRPLLLLCLRWKNEQSGVPSYGPWSKALACCFCIFFFPSEGSTEVRAPTLGQKHALLTLCHHASAL